MPPALMGAAAATPGRGEERKLSAKFTTDSYQLLISFYCFFTARIILKQDLMFFSYG